MPCVVLLSHLEQGVRQITAGLERGGIQGECGAIAGDGTFQLAAAVPACPTLRHVLHFKGGEGSALESLTQVLRLRDDFVAALAEVSEQRMRMLRDGDATDQAENALAAVVPISARWTEADAIAGARPIAMSSVDDVRP